ncbi:MAG: glycosyltransferase [Kouleothrix sp.]
MCRVSCAARRCRAGAAFAHHPQLEEQFGRVLPEAMSCGLPMIGSSSGEIPNVVGDAG